MRNAPGTWERRGAYVYDGNDFTIADCDWCNKGPSMENADKAHADFIVAADKHFQPDGTCNFEKLCGEMEEALREMREVFQEYIDWRGAVHVGECPQDDTCNCDGKKINDKISRVFIDSYPLLSRLQAERKEKS